MARKTTEFTVEAASKHGAFKKVLPKIVEADIMAPDELKIVGHEDGAFRVRVAYNE